MGACAPEPYYQLCVMAFWGQAVTQGSGGRFDGGLQGPQVYLIFLRSSLRTNATILSLRGSFASSPTPRTFAGHALTHFPHPSQRSSP